MSIQVNLDLMMVRRHISAGELAERVGITPANLSILKNNKAKALLEYVPEEDSVAEGE